jgi:hypothetical protein
VLWVDSQLDKKVLEIKVSNDGLSIIKRKKLPSPMSASRMLHVYKWAKQEKHTTIETLDEEIKRLTTGVSEADMWEEEMVIDLAEEVLPEFFDDRGGSAGTIQYSIDKQGRRMIFFHLRTVAHYAKAPETGVFTNSGKKKSKKKKSRRSNMEVDSDSENESGSESDSGDSESGSGDSDGDSSDESVGSFDEITLESRRSSRSNNRNNNKRGARSKKQQQKTSFSAVEEQMGQLQEVMLNQQLRHAEDMAQMRNDNSAGFMALMAKMGLSDQQQHPQQPTHDEQRAAFVAQQNAALEWAAQNPGAVAPDSVGS